MILKIELRDHISAGELRELGFNVPRGVPDDWIIPRAALIPAPGSVKVSAEDENKINVSIEFKPVASFRPPLEYELSDEDGNRLVDELKKLEE